ncbi:MAG: hypothetical protein IPM92_13135 [Saprospiraceae bacterium]|nr:hypothetical protein [Saprospiraceae bacterium]
MIFAGMDLQGERLIYMGHTDSMFTKCFVPVLSLLKGIRLTCVFIDEPQRTVWPESPDYLLRIFIFWQRICNSVNKIFISYYWSVFCYQKSVELYFFKTLDDERLDALADASDYLLSAGIQTKLPHRFLMKFKKRALNFHYSLLPKHRGTFPIFWQKCLGDHDFGYSFHIITDQMDAGEIVLQERLDLNPGLPDSSICDLLTRHASFQLYRLFGDSATLKMQDETIGSNHTMLEYIDYVNVTFQSARFSMQSGSKRWIINQRYVLHTGDFIIECSIDGVIRKGFKLYIALNGKGIEIKRVNYLPAVFYFWSLKKLFAKQ